MNAVSSQDVFGMAEMSLDSVVSHKGTTKNAHLTHLHTL